MSITTHVLDIARGKPAEGVSVTLSLRASGGHFETLGKAKTDANGRCSSLTHADHPVGPGVYRLNFDIGEYHEANRVEGLFPEVAVEFLVREPGQKFHIPLLISPFGYTTYRGS
jgi:5-hydroxyisourate hydrolase